MTVDLHVALLGVVVVLVTSRLLEAKPGIVGRDGIYIKYSRVVL